MKSKFVENLAADLETVTPEEIREAEESLRDLEEGEEELGVLNPDLRKVSTLARRLAKDLEIQIARLEQVLSSPIDQTKAEIICRGETLRIGLDEIRRYLVMETRADLNLPNDRIIIRAGWKVVVPNLICLCAACSSDEEDYNEEQESFVIIHFPPI